MFHDNFSRCSFNEVLSQVKIHGINVRDFENKTPLLGVLTSSNKKTNSEYDETMTQHCIYGGHLFTPILETEHQNHKLNDTVRQLLEWKADVNICAPCRDTDKKLPLHFATMHDTHTVQLLLDAKADINAIDVNGKNALYHSVEFHNARVFHFLIEKGIDVDQKTCKNETVLDRILIAFCYPSIFPSRYSIPSPVYYFWFIYQLLLVEVSLERIEKRPLDSWDELGKVGTESLSDYLNTEISTYRPRRQLLRKLFVSNLPRILEQEKKEIRRSSLYPPLLNLVASYLHVESNEDRLMLCKTFSNSWEEISNGHDLKIFTYPTFIPSHFG